jgi:COPII coat assembly protein SEC16
LTPKKFQSLHSFVRLSNGVMTTVNSDNGYTVKLENIPIFDSTRRLYQSYPGPLVRGTSHKKTVIEFCEEKLKQDQAVSSSYRASYSLLWSYLILMLRQNGNYTEADISELLMKNSEEFKASLTNSSIEEVKNAANDDATDVSENEENVGSEKNSNSNSVSQSQEEETTSGSEGKGVLHKFRDYLLYGNINDALDFATDNNLWGHALFLASKVDRRQHANVMLKFANKLPYNDPLQTLYQIMSGRMPSCVTSLDDKWGDWRPHLAMIISNCTDKPELVKRSIMALGDSLTNRGDIFGSQFCYLLVEPQFREYSDAVSDGKIALLGISHQKPFKEFATDDAIIMTEVYEYARSLSDEHFFVPSLQKYKLLLAGKMLDYGMQLKCLLYTEQIAKTVVAQPSIFDIKFLLRVHSLAERMKYYDPVMEKSYEDNYNNNGLDTTEDQKWLQDLTALVYSLSNQPTQEHTPQHSVNNDIYNPLSYTSSSGPSATYDPNSQHQSPAHASLGYYQGDSSIQDANQAENSIPYQQGYTEDYNSQMMSQNPADSSQSFADQTQTDQSFQNNYQNASQSDYNYGWDQVNILGFESMSPSAIKNINSQNNYQQPQPTITMGNTASNKFEASQKNEEDEKNHSPAKKPVNDKSKKTSQQDVAHVGGSGWFGGIFSKLSIKPKNQMILPDDKNPTVSVIDIKEEESQMRIASNISDCVGRSYKEVGQ